MIDAWTGPTPTPQQFPANEPDGIRKLLGKIKDIETNLREVTSNLLRTAGIRLSPAGMTIDSDLAITGTLSLPAGIIGNDALTSPVVPQSVYGYVSNFAITTTGTTIRTITITVPVGFTSAVVSVTGRVFGVNPNTTGGSNGAGADYLYGVAKIDGLSSTALALPVGGNNGSGINVSPYSTILTGLTSGATFTITLNVQSYFASWGTIANNTADVSGSILWFR